MNPGRKLRGIEAVIDKDLCSELLARELEADFFIMATDADAVFLDWGKPSRQGVPPGQPRACEAQLSGRLDGAEGRRRLPFRRGDREKAAIGALKDLAAILRGEAGTTITSRPSRSTWHDG